jgi:hypothetical protein
MAMSDEQREALRERNRRRRGCPRCGNAKVRFVWGSECGGLDQIVYKLCGGCGHAEATKRTKP